MKRSLEKLAPFRIVHDTSLHRGGVGRGRGVGRGLGVALGVALGVGVTVGVPVGVANGARRRSWRRTLSGCSENRAKAAYCGSGVCLSKGNVIKVLVCAAFLASPGLSSICRSNDCAQLSNCCSVIGGSVKETPRRISETPLVWLTQVCPPSVVLRMVPKSPTTVPVLASANQTARS